MRRTVQGLVFCSVLLLTAGLVRAQDVLGPVGTIAGLQVNSVHADAYLSAHGRVYVKNADNTLAVYNFGGTICGTRVLTDHQVATLQRGLDNKKVRIRPIYQTGQGDLLCLVGFTLVPKQNLTLVNP